MKLLMGLALAATAAPQQYAPAAPRLQRIEMKTTTWGHPLVSWTIDAEGNGRLTLPDPDPFKATQMVTRSFAVGTAGFRRIRVLIGIAEQRAPGNLHCTVAATDAPSGTVRWVPSHGRTASLSFYTACSEFSARSVVAQLDKAEALIEEWAKAGPVVEVVPVARQ